MYQLRSGEFSTLKDLGFAFDLDVPFGPFFLFEKLIDHAINRSKFFSWVHFDLVQESSHAWSTVSDLIWNTVEKTEFWRHEVLSSLLPGDEHGLALLGDLELVLLPEVLGHTDFDAVAQLEEGGARALVEADVVDDVGPLGAVVGDDALPHELQFARLLESSHQVRVRALTIWVNLIVDFVNLAKNSKSRHEPGTIVDDKSTSRLVFVGGSLETLPDLHVHILNKCGIFGIEELWSMSELEHASLRHGLLHDDVEDLTHRDAVLSLRIVDVCGVDDVLALMIDF